MTDSWSTVDYVAVPVTIVSPPLDQQVELDLHAFESALERGKRFTLDEASSDSACP
jgi:hypothetical protein